MEITIRHFKPPASVCRSALNKVDMRAIKIVFGNISLTNCKPPVVDLRVKAGLVE